MVMTKPVGHPPVGLFHFSIFSILSFVNDATKAKFIFAIE